MLYRCIVLYLLHPTMNVDAWQHIYLRLSIKNHLLTSNSWLQIIYHDFSAPTLCSDKSLCLFACVQWFTAYLSYYTTAIHVTSTCYIITRTIDNITISPLPSQAHGLTHPYIGEFSQPSNMIKSYQSSLQDPSCPAGRDGSILPACWRSQSSFWWSWKPNTMLQGSGWHPNPHETWGTVGWWMSQDVTMQQVYIDFQTFIFSKLFKHGSLFLSQYVLHSFNRFLMISPMQVWIPRRAIMPNSWRNPYKSCQDCGFLRWHLLKSCQSLSQLILAWIYHPRCHSLKGPGWLFPQLLHTWRIAKCESSVVADGQQIWVWGLKGRANVPEMGSGQRVPLECNSFHAVPINQYIETLWRSCQMFASFKKSSSYGLTRI